jgi:hypothetical protein
VGQDWPSPHHHEPHPLPRVEDLPVAWEGYDRERVQAAFNEFYRHIAQLDTTLRALESVDVFRQQAGDLRAELRSMRSAGWSPYPRGYALTPERSLFGSVPDAVPRIALEVVFLVVVAAVVAVAKFSSLEIVAVMAGAVVITFLVELVAARDRPSTTPIPAAEAVRPAAPAPAPEKPVVTAKKEPVAAAVEESTAGDELPAPAVADAEEDSVAVAQPGAAVDEQLPPADDGSGWAAFAEPAGPQPLTVMGALSEDEEPQPADAPDERLQLPETPDVPEAEVPPEPEPEAEQEPAPGQVEPADDATEEETGTIARRHRLRRRKRDVHRPHEPPAPAPKHVRVLPPPESAVAEVELAPWERGFDDTEERR